MNTNFQEKLVSQLQKLSNEVTENKILPENALWIKKFHDETITQGLSPRRQDWYLAKLRKLTCGLKKPFDALTKEEVKQLVRNKIELSNQSTWTKTGYKITLRLLYKVIEGVDWTEKQLPQRVSWIKIKTPRNQLKREELLTIEDIREIVDSCTNIQDKAIVATLFEGGFRSGEFLGMTIACVRSDKYGCVVSVDGKTGTRTVRLVYSAPFLVEWLQLHPCKKDTSNSLWISMAINKRHEPLGGAGLTKKLKMLAHNVGIKNKKLNPHSWRHASCTHMARYLSESVMKKYYGWTADSKMAATYVHLNGKDVSEEILKLHGLTEVDNDRGITIRQCPRCNLIISTASKFCSKCGLCLDENEAQKLYHINNEVVPRSLIQAVKEELLNELKAKEVENK